MCTAYSAAPPSEAGTVSLESVIEVEVSINCEPEHLPQLHRRCGANGVAAYTERFCSCCTVVDMRLSSPISLCVAIGSTGQGATGSRPSHHPIRLDSRIPGTSNDSVRAAAAHDYKCWILAVAPLHGPAIRPMPSTHQYASSFTTRSLVFAFSP